MGTLTNFDYPLTNKHDRLRPILKVLMGSGVDAQEGQ